MPSESVVDSRLFSKIDLNNASEVNSAVAVDRALLGHLASQLLLYERIIIPTYDFGIVPALISWLGLDLYEELMQAGALALMRRRGLLGYVGNGNAISTFGIERGEGRPLSWWGRAIFSSNDESIELQLANAAEPLPSHDIERAVAQTLSHSLDLEYENDFFIQSIANESYTDVMESAWLSRYVLDTSARRDDGSVDLRWLPQVRADQVRVLRADGRIRDPVDLVLRVAEVNMELLMADRAGGADLLTSQNSERLLLEKVRRAGAPQDILEGFIHLLELNELPDIPAAIVDGTVSASDIWEIRNTPDAVQFREWLREEAPRNADELTGAYIRALGRETLADRMPVRLLRLAITSVAGLIPGVGGFLGGLAAEAVDSFFVERWLQGYSPKLFIDELQRLTPDDAPQAERSEDDSA